MQAVAYARYSSDNQRAESITAQLRAIHTYAAQKSIHIIKEYIDEAETATNDDRSNFQRMIDDLAHIRPKLILVHKVDRFARNRDDAGHYRWLFKKMGGSRVIAVAQDFGDTPEASLMEGNLESYAEYFSRNLSGEVKKGLYENVVQGMHCGGIPPLGYDVGPDLKYIINEREAQAVRLIFNMKLKGHNYKEISQALNVEGYLTKASKKKPGKPFGKNSLHDILRNEKYIGTYVYRKTSPENSRIAEDPLATIRLEAIIPRIIDDQTFNAVQEILNNRQHHTRSTGDVVYMLSGVARCGVCGQAMAGNSYVSKGKKYYYYRCNNAARTHGQACNHGKKYNKTDLEVEVITKAKKALAVLRKTAEQVIDQVYERVLAQNEADNNAKRQDLEELRKTQTAIDNLIGSIADGVDAKILAPKLNELGKKKELLAKRIKRSEANQATREEIADYVNAILEKAIDPDRPEECRADLRAIFGQIMISPETPIKLSFERLGSWR